MIRKLETEIDLDDDDSGDGSGGGSGDDSGDASDGNSAGSDLNAEESDGASEHAKETKQSSVKTGSKRKRGNQSRKPSELSIKVPKISKGKLYKPPTNEELNQLKETENLFHSTLFRMQITELLSEVSLKSKRRREIEKSVSTLRTVLTGLKKGPKYELQDYSWLTDLGIEVPFMMEPAKVKGSFQFVAPTDVRVTGSFLSDTCIKPHVTVDLIVVMPKAFFETKDFLNQRYLRKRALYICKLAAELSECSVVEDMKFTYLHGNPLKPVLVLDTKVEGHKSVRMQVHAIPESGTFIMKRFCPEINNVRSHWFKGLDDAKNIPEKDVPTPFYNCSMLEDITALTAVDTVEKTLSTYKSVKEGIMLLKVWLRQRELDKGYGCFNGDVMTLYVCYLLSQKKLNTFMSSYQIFRNTVLRLSQSDWVESGITMCSESFDTSIPPLHEFHKHFDVVFVDSTGYFNICYAMNRTIFSRVRHEALLAMKFLEDGSVDSFEKLFIKKCPFTLTFDHLFHTDLSKNIEQTVDRFGLCDREVDYGGLRVHMCLSAVSVLLEKALGQRIHLLQLNVAQPSMWNIKEKQEESGSVLCGLVLDSELAFNVLDRGPAADTPEAVEFQKFWGQRSELRRFRDGGICEAVLWLDKTNIAGKQLVCEHIVKFALNRHACISPTAVKYIGYQLDSVLHMPVTHTLEGQTQYGCGEEENLAVIHAYDDLCKMLRNLKDLPLTINSIQGTSPCFRYTEVFPPLPCTFRHREYSNLTDGLKRFVPGEDRACPFYIHTLKVVCTLESSGKWPDDKEALKRLKMAFYLELAESLKSKYNVPVKVGLGYVDVLKGHYVFRLVLGNNREIAVLKSIKTSDGKLLMRDTEEALTLEKEIVALPRLTSTLHGLQQQHPSYSTSTRLAKRWVAAHMLSDHIDQVAIDLLVASLYLAPAPFQVPSTGLSGFQRFLELLSTFDWKTNPLLINLNNEFTVEDLAEIPAKFTQERSSLPLMFISTPLDKYRSHWTKQTPSVSILNRMVLLAIKSLEVLQQQISSNESLDLQQVFRPSLSIYDALIHLSEEQLPRKHEALDIDRKCQVSFGKSVEEDRFPVVDFNPPRLLLNELKEAFGDLCLFFYDEHGGTVIGVLWNPSKLQLKEFKVSEINYSQLHTDSSGALSLAPNLEAVLEDIKIMGRGIISRIDLKEKDTW